MCVCMWAVRRQRFKTCFANWKADAAASLSLRRMQRKVLRALMMRGARRGMNAWRAKAAEVVAAKHRAAGALRTFSPEGRAKRAAWNSLRELVQQRQLMRRAAKAIVLQGARRGYNAWRALLAEAHARRDRLLGAINSLRQVGTKRAINAWRAVAADLGAARRQAVGALRTFSPEGRKTRAAWNSWIELVEQRAVMMGAVKSLVQRGLRKCMNGWKALASEAAATKLAMVRVAQSIRMRGSRQAWNAWEAMAAERGAAKLAAASVLNSMRPEGRKKRAAWNSWFELFQERVLMRRAAKSLILQGQCKSFNAWKGVLEAAAATKLAMMRVAQSIRMRGTRQAWNAWEALAAEVAAAKRAAAGALRTMSPEGRKMRAGFNSWLAMVEARAKHRQQLRTLSPEGRQTRAAWNSWFELFQERLLMRRAGSSLVLQGQRKCFNGWLSMVEEKAAAKQALLRAAQSLRMRGARLAWNAWLEMLAEPS